MCKDWGTLMRFVLHLAGGGGGEKEAGKFS